MSEPSNETAASDVKTGMPVPESPMLLRRLGEMRQNERAAPYLYWFFLLMIVGLTPFFKRPAYSLVVIMPFLIIPYFHLRRPMLARAIRVTDDYVQLEAGRGRTVIHFSMVAKCVELPVSWDDSGESPFMKSIVQLVLTLTEPPPRSRCVLILEGRDRTVSRALAAAGVPIVRAKWASKYADETGIP